MTMQSSLKSGLSRMLFFTRPTMIYEQIKSQAVAAVPFARHVGVAITKVTRGSAAAEISPRPELLNHVGTMHAAALFALGEATSGAAMAGTLAPLILNVRPVASAASIRYLKPAKGRIQASGRVRGEPDNLVGELNAQGKVRFELDVVMTDEQGQSVCEMTVEWHARLNR